MPVALFRELCRHQLTIIVIFETQNVYVDTQIAKKLFLSVPKVTKLVEYQELFLSVAKLKNNLDYQQPLGLRVFRVVDSRFDYEYYE